MAFPALRYCTPLVLAAAVAASGCLGRRNVELLESRLRDREDEVHQLQGELDRTRTDLLAARREVSRLQSGLTSVTSLNDPAETIHAVARATGIRINRLQSGGLDQDEQAGDELLHAVIEPVDGNGQVLAVPGELTLEVTDPARPRGERELARVHYSRDRAEKRWHNGLLSTGYHVQLPWEHPPAGETVVVHARLTTPDGRSFSSTETVRVTPSAVAAREQKNPSAATRQPVSETDGARESRRNRDALSTDAAPQFGPATARITPAGFRRLPLDDLPAEDTPSEQSTPDGGDDLREFFNSTSPR